MTVELSASGVPDISRGEAYGLYLASADSPSLEDVPENARTFALARAWLGDPAPGA
jgi:hypothetical protein